MSQPIRPPLGPSCAMPLDPRLLDRVIASKRALFAGELLPDQPSDDLLDVESLVKILARPARTRPDTLTAPGAHLATVVGSRKVLVLLVDFSDSPATQDQQHYEDLLFSQGTLAKGSMRDFYREAPTVSSTSTAP